MGYQRLAAEIRIVLSSLQERWRVNEVQKPPTRPDDVGMWWMTHFFLPFFGPCCALVSFRCFFRRRSHVSCNPQSSTSRRPAATGRQPSRPRQAREHQPERAHHNNNFLHNSPSVHIRKPRELSSRQRKTVVSANARCAEAFALGNSCGQPRFTEHANLDKAGAKDENDDVKSGRQKEVYGHEFAASFSILTCVTEEAARKEILSLIRSGAGGRGKVLRDAKRCVQEVLNFLEVHVGDHPPNECSSHKRPEGEL